MSNISAKVCLLGMSAKPSWHANTHSMIDVCRFYFLPATGVVVVFVAVLGIAAAPGDLVVDI